MLVTWYFLFRRHDYTSTINTYTFLGFSKWLFLTMETGGNSNRGLQVNENGNEVSDWEWLGTENGNKSTGMKGNGNNTTPTICQRAPARHPTNEDKLR